MKKKIKIHRWLYQSHLFQFFLKLGWQLFGKPKTAF